MDFNFKNVMYNGGWVSVPISPYPFRKCQPLSKELRFVRVLPADDTDGVIKCQIFHEVLEQVEYFAALSYEWGDPSCCGIVIIDGIQVPVAVKLIEALWYLRQSNCPVLWIDVLCINQEDNHERNAHLKLMTDIYHEADIVCAYIGPAIDGSNQVMDILRHIDQSRSPKRPQQAAVVPWTPSEMQLLALEVELKAFFNRSYWHRVWIIQEIALSSRLRVFCGSSSVRWVAVELLIQLLSALPQFERMDWTIKYLSDMRLKQLQKTPIGLLQLLHSSHSAKATDRRDRVYALLGLCFDGSDYVAEPHYDWSESMICLNITRTTISKRRTLDIMLARTEPSVDNLPSWCPDYFSCPSEQVWSRMAAYITGFDEKYRMGQRSTRWKATDNSIIARRDLSFTDDQLLTVQGFCLGVIDSIGCTLSDQPDTLPQNAYGLTGTNTLGSPGSSSSKDEEKRYFQSLARLLNAYIRPATSQAQTPTGNISGDYGAVKLYYHLYNFEKFDHLTRTRRYKADFEKIQQWRKLNKNFMIRGIRFKDRSNNIRAAREAGRVGEWLEFGATAFADGLARGAVNAFLGSGSSSSGGSSVQEKLPSDLEGALLGLSDLIDEGLRLVTTDSGRVGWAHPSTQLGDCVYLLQGCSMPVILRHGQPEHGKASGQFNVVGHGIVDEAMDGNLWSALLRNTPAQYVTLR